MAQNVVTITIENENGDIIGLDMVLPKNMTIKELRLKMAKALETEGIEGHCWN
jgi:hypothetical protein